MTEEAKNYQVQIAVTDSLSFEQSNTIARIISEVLPQVVVSPSDLVDEKNILKYKLTEEEAKTLSQKLKEEGIGNNVIIPMAELVEGKNKAVPLKTFLGPDDIISENPNVLLGFISFFLPIVGFIMGLVYVTRPRVRDKATARICFFWTIMGILVPIIISSIFLYQEYRGFYQQHREFFPWSGF